MTEQPLHITINHNRSRFFLLRSLPCAECGFSIPASREQSSVHVKPVTYASQEARCPRCSASNMVLSARTEADCAQLERLVAGMDGELMVNKKSLEPAD